MLGAAGLTLQEVALRFSTENEARVYLNPSVGRTVQSARTAAPPTAHIPAQQTRKLGPDPACTSAVNAMTPTQ